MRDCLTQCQENLSMAFNKRRFIVTQMHLRKLVLSSSE
uniref:Uncharacterized protein n=1 Tax=Arundo donax TaxID=35708 RepID=A0A0A9QG41_ARUDO